MSDGCTETEDRKLATAWSLLSLYWRCSETIFCYLNCLKTIKVPELISNSDSILKPGFSRV